MAYEVKNDVRPQEVRTFSNYAEAVAYLREEGATNGLAGWRRPLRKGERRKVANPITDGFAFYFVREV